MLFCQLEYPQELGTGKGFSIAEYGCAMTSVASLLVNCFHIDTTPLQLNADLNRVGGFAPNGTPGVLDLLDWEAITHIYEQVVLVFNNTYYNPPNGQGLPADMQLIDNQLARGESVIVGVSFAHNPKEPYPTHYVEIYRKNTDGTYQMRDSMFRDAECDTVFDHRYAVNGMSVAECILQAVSYHWDSSPSSSISPSASQSGSVSASMSPSSSVSPSIEATLIDTPVEEVKATVPIAATIPNVQELPVSSQTVNTLKDLVHTVEIERNNAISKAKIIADKYESDFRNYTALVAAGYETVEKVDKIVGGVKNDLEKHRKQLVEVLKSSQDMAVVYAQKCKEDATAIESGMVAVKQLEDLQLEFRAVAQIHNAKPTFNSIASAWDMLLTRYNILRKQVKASQVQQAVQVAEKVAQSPVVKRLGLTDWINVFFGIVKEGEQV